MASQPQKFLSVEEYLEIERHSEFRSAYDNGEIFPIEAATGDHALICLNTGAELRDALRATTPRNCRAFDGSVMVYQPGPNKPVYADITVVCGEPVYRDAHNDVV